MKFNKFFFLICFCLFSCSTMNEQLKNRVPAQVMLEDHLSTDDKLKILLAIHKEIPELFADAARYDIDLLKILDEQTQLQNLLSRYPQFLEEWEKKKFLEMIITVKGKSEKIIESKRISPSAVGSWRNKLIEAAEDLIKNKKDLKTETLLAVKALENRTSSGFLNGLILNLPKELQSEARILQKKGDWIGLEFYLDKNLSTTLEKFISTPPESNLSKVVLIKKWKEIIEIEKKAGPLADLSILTSNKGISVSALHSLAKHMGALDHQDLENLADRDYQKKALLELGRKENESLPPFYERHLKFYTSQTEVTQSVAEDGYKISLKEQNPNIAIFRGCTGGDCSSQFSFPYPNDPNERVFFIYDKDQHLKGYVSSTVVTGADGQKGLYVITVSGNRVNAEDTELIFQTLYKEREALGVKNIFLPSSDNLKGLINFLPIRSVYEESIKDGKVVPLVYNGKEIRKSIESYKTDYNKAEYDHMAKNTHGVNYIPKKAREIPISTQVKNFSDKGTLGKENFKIDMVGMLDFQIALKQSGRKELLEEIKKGSLLKEDEIEKLDEVMTLILEKKKISTTEIEKEADEFCSYFHLGDKEKKSFREKYLFNAYLSATDAFEAPYYETNMKRLLEDFKSNATEPILTRDGLIYQKWENELTKHPKYQTLKEYYITALAGKDVVEKLADDFTRFSVVLRHEKIELPRKVLKELLTLAPDNKFFVNEVIDYAIKNADTQLLKNVIQDVFAGVDGHIWEDLIIKVLMAAKEFGDKTLVFEIVQNVVIPRQLPIYKNIAEVILPICVELRDSDSLQMLVGAQFHRVKGPAGAELIEKGIKASVDMMDSGALKMLMWNRPSNVPPYFDELMKAVEGSTKWDVIRNIAYGVKPTNALPCKDSLKPFLK